MILLIMSILWGVIAVVFFVIVIAPSRHGNFGDDNSLLIDSICSIMLGFFGMLIITLMCISTKFDHKLPININISTTDTTYSYRKDNEVIVKAIPNSGITLKVSEDGKNYVSVERTVLKYPFCKEYRFDINLFLADPNTFIVNNATLEMLLKHGITTD